MTSREINLNLEGTKAEIIYHRFKDIKVKTFLVSFNTKGKVLSTLEGIKEVKFVGNHYNPPPLWDFVHKNKEEYQRWVLADLGINLEDIAILYTGADMDNLSFELEKFQNVKICVCATAGVKSNAQRIGVDKAGSVEKEGKFEHLGTINIIILTNASFTDGAMARSIITVTEAKIQALQDLDIRSSYNPEIQATGTGTDNVIVVSAFEGPKITYVGGHAKIGEIMAETTTSAVKEAIFKQDRIKK